MKKKLFSILLISIAIAGYSTTHTITNSGTTFSPSTITIQLGDSIFFDLSSNHNAVEVSQETWNANGNTALPGFSVPFDGGIVPASSLPLGIHYFVCTPHASIGMKGTITVQTTVGIDETTNEKSLLVYPNPSNGLFELNISNMEEQSKLEISVYDISGAEIFHSELLNDGKNAINLLGYTKGIYLLKVNNGNEIYTQRLILR